MLEEFLIHTKANSLSEAEIIVARYVLEGITEVPKDMKGGIKTIIYDCSGDITRKLNGNMLSDDYLPLAGEIDFLLRNGERDPKKKFFDILSDESYYINLNRLGHMDFYFILTRTRPTGEEYSNFAVRLENTTPLDHSI